MKKTLLIALTAFSGVAQAQLVTSGFENWTGGLPDGWFGARSSILAPAVIQVTENPHGGTSAVRLENTTGDHKRFTTQDVTVTAGTTYTINFWCRGQGDIRFGVYDGRTGSSNGYAPYTGYTTVSNAAEWTEYTMTTNVLMDVSNAQFVLSVKSTVAPEHIVIDDVTITEAGAIQEVSIHDIQFTSNPNGDSPYNGQVVRTTGIVTAIDGFANNGNPQNVYYLQDGSGAWNGIYVFDFVTSGNVVAVGDEVELVAGVTEYYNLTELANIQSFTVLASGQPLPAPIVVGTGEVASEALESVLVRVVDSPCTIAPSGATFGIWSVDDGSGVVGIGKQMHTTSPDPVVGQVFDVTGVVSFEFSEYRIQPRNSADVSLATSIGDLNGAQVTLFPNPATNALTLDLGTLNGRTEYSLVDATGRIVLTDVATSVRSTIDVTALTNGMYVLTLRNNASAWSARIAVQH